MALAETLNRGTDPFASVKKLASKTEPQERADVALQQLEPAMRGEAAAREFATREEARFKREKAAAETGAEEQFAAGKRKAVEQFQTGLPERPLFNPTEFEPNSAGELAGLTAIIGTIAGRTSARAALKSMSGLTRGAREGRADLYDKEVKQFESDIKAWKDNIGLAKDKLSQVIDLLGTDRTAALVKAKELEPMLQDGLALAKVRQQDFKGALDVINNALKTGDQIDLALQRSTGKTQGLKPGVDLVNKHLMKMRLSGYAQQMQNSLKDPEFAQKVDKFRALAFAQEQSPIADQILQQQIPEDVRQFLILAKRFRNEVYRTESGLAVTAYEQLRQYGAVPQPGDSARALVTKLQTLERGMRDDMANEQRVFPDLLIASQRAGLAPVTAQTAAQTEGRAAEANVDRRNLPIPQSQAEFNALAPGALYIDPDDNQIYRKPKAGQ